MSHHGTRSKSSGLLEVNRREFLSGCAACAASAVCVPALALGRAPAAGVQAAGVASDEKAKIRLVFSHISPQEKTWPYQGYDYEARKRELTARLRQACPNVEFLPTTVQSAEEAKKLLATGLPMDGQLVYLVGIWSGAVEVLANSGRPTLLVDDAYAGSGEFLIQYAAARRKGLKVAGVSSSRFEDVGEAVRCFECLKKMRSSVILDVIDRQPGEQAKAIQEVFGTQVRQTSAEEVNEAYRKADRTQAQQYAKRWIDEAHAVVEPAREDIEKSAVMYIAMRDLMRQHKAQAITVDCLTLFYGGKLPAYPCLGFFQLNNDGLVGACEADLPSTISMLLMTYLVGRPGYISDPVIDTSKSQVIYAHCVAPSKVYGPAGASNPYDIRSHSEDRKGAAVRSLMPLGEMTTTLKFDPLRHEVVVHQAKTVENIDEDKACRTKLAAEVKDIDKLMTEWDRWGWHRVTFYGDLKRPVENLAALAGFKVVWES
jgi:phosphotransferase system IIB component